MIITFVSVLLWFNCKILLSYALYASVNAFIFLILFLNFYAKTYNKKREVRTTEDKNKWNVHSPSTIMENTLVYTKSGREKSCFGTLR